MKVGDKVYLPNGEVGTIYAIDNSAAYGFGDPLAPAIASIEVIGKGGVTRLEHVRLDLLKPYGEKPKPVEERVSEVLHSLEDNIEKLQTAIFNGELEDVGLGNQNDMLAQLHHMNGYIRELRKRYERMSK